MTTGLSHHTKYPQAKSGLSILKSDYGSRSQKSRLK